MAPRIKTEEELAAEKRAKANKKFLPKAGRGSAAVSAEAVKNSLERKRKRDLGLGEAERNLRLAEKDRSKMGTIGSKVGRFLTAAQKVNQRAKEKGLMNFGREAGAAAYALPKVRENIDAGVATLHGSTGELADRTARWYADRPEGSGQMTRGEKLARATKAGIAGAKGMLPDVGGKPSGVDNGDTDMPSGNGVTEAIGEPVATPTPSAAPAPMAKTGARLWAPGSGGTSGRDRLNEMFPDREANLASYGIKSSGASPEQKIESQRNENIRNAKTVEDKQALVDQYAQEDRGDVARGEGIAAQQDLAQAAIQGEVMKAVSGDQMAMAKMQNAYQISDRKTRGDMLAKIGAEIYGNDMIEDPATAFTNAVQQVSKATGDQQAQAGVETPAGGADMNNDGKVDASEQEYDSAVRLLEKTGSQMTPTDKLKLNTKIAELKKKILNVG